MPASRTRVGGRLAALLFLCALLGPGASLPAEETGAVEEGGSAALPPDLGLVRPEALGSGGLSPSDEASLPGLPAIGRWMVNPKGQVADWLGLRAGGKTVAEPINLIIVDEVSKDPAEAVARLAKALVSQGFPERGGHSQGYSARIGGLPCPEILLHSKGTFSDASFVRENDHGRIFGPLQTAAGIVFTAAFSRERLDSLRMHHLLVSFNVARDNVASALEASGLYRIQGFVPLGNALFFSPRRTTWDHDGNAVLVEAVDPGSPGQG